MDEKTLAALTALANKLGTTAEHLWGVLVRQAPYSAGMDVLLAVAAVLVFVWAFGKYKNFDFDNVGEFDRGPAKLFSIAGLVVLGIVVAVVVDTAARNALTAIYNPEYWALQKLLGR